MGQDNQMGNDNRGWMLSVFADDLTGLPTKVQHKLEATRILEQTSGKYAYVSCGVADVKYVSEMYGKLAKIANPDVPEDMCIPLLYVAEIYGCKKSGKTDFYDDRAGIRISD